MTEKPVTTGVFDTLPDAADMPRIMDERKPRNVRDLVSRQLDPRGWARGVYIDTRTRAQLDDGCDDDCCRCSGTEK